MAKGGGGEGHYDARRRAKKSMYPDHADSPEVLSAIVKPRAKPKLKTKRVKVESHAGEVTAPSGMAKMKTTSIKPSTSMKVTRYNQPGTGIQRQGALEAELRSQRKFSTPASSRSSPVRVGSGATAGLSRLRDQSWNPLSIRTGALEAELRDLPPHWSQPVGKSDPWLTEHTFVINPRRHRGQY